MKNKPPEKRSVRDFAKQAKANDALARARVLGKFDTPAVASLAKTSDSLQNFAAGLGIGTSNLSSATTYGFNPITRIRTLLEWIHRGTWIGGVAIDLVADDMTRAGVTMKGDIDPDDSAAIEEQAGMLGVWNGVNDVIKWSRLYGGCIGVLLIDGQKLSTPFRIETVGQNQFKGIYSLDRWQVECSLSDLVTEWGPHMGLPKFYTVTQDAPMLYGQKIHYSRIMRLEGIRLPWQQRLQENLWGLSVLERMYDRMIAFDSATTGAAQLVYKSYLRTYKLKDFRTTVAGGGKMFEGLVKTVQFMRQTQSNEGITLLDMGDEMETMAAPPFSGLNEALLQFAMQISGALQVPMTRLFGQSPGGLNSTGESDLRTYYDGINQQQNRHLLGPLTIAYRCIAQSNGIKVPKGFGLTFNPLWQMTETEKGDLAKSVTETVMSAVSSGLISDQVGLKELKESSVKTGVWTNITDDEIEAADDTPRPPVPEGPDVGAGSGAGEGSTKSKVEEGEESPSPKRAGDRRTTNDCDESAKLTQKQAGYHAERKGENHCGICARFQSPELCQIVRGPIAAEGGCDFFLKKIMGAL